MLLPTEVVRHVREFQLSLTRNAVTAFDVPHGHRLTGSTAPDLAAHYGSHDLDRRNPIIEAIEGEITDLFFRGIRPARKPLVFVIR